MTKCLLISPRFPDGSYWNYREPCELTGARYPSPPLGLITVAALLPAEWDVRLLDLNVEEMDRGLIDWADIVLTGGMITQQFAILDLIELCHAHGKPVAVGGQHPTSQPEVYEAAEFLVLDEGEMTVPAFLDDFRAGASRGVYRAEGKPDVTASPVPRYDLLNFDRYLMVGVQFSRGCPFNCEFCDIIELYGRKPRTKTPEQMLRELESLYRLGYRGHVDLVDDNFIGNKRDAMAFLSELRAWSRARGYPFFFSTEASLNLADDVKLLELMEAVDFRWVFVGIETPDETLLTLTQKKQNLRRPVVESVARLNRHGLVVTAGYILGFDGETRAAAPAIVECMEAAGIAFAMPALLTALPHTQLTRRLVREGRLIADYWNRRPSPDQMTGGLNFLTSRPRADILEDFAATVRRLYSPRSYFDRALLAATRLRRRAKHRVLGRGLRELGALPWLAWRLGCGRDTAYYFWRNFLRVLLTRPANVQTVCVMMAMYLHFRKQTRVVLEVLEREIAASRASDAARPDASVAALAATR